MTRSLAPAALILAALAAEACVAILGAHELPETSDAGGGASGGGGGASSDAGPDAPATGRDAADAADAPPPGPCDCPATQDWVKAFSVSGDATVAGVAVDTEGHVVIAGSVSGTLDVEGHSLAGSGSADHDVFVVALDACGEYRWGRRFGDTLEQEAGGLAIDPSLARKDAVLLTGTFSGTLDFAGVTSPLTAMGRQAFFARLDPVSGAGVDSSARGTAAGGTSIAGAADGTTYAVGTEGNQASLFARRFDTGLTPTNEMVATCPQCTAAIAITPGGAAMAGGFQGSLTIPQGPTWTSKGSTDLYLTSLVPSMTGFSSMHGVPFGDPSPQFAAGVASDAAGSVVVAGGFGGMLKVGGAANQKAAAAGLLDVFVAGFDPMMAPLWLSGFGSAGATDQATGIAFQNGRVAVVGDFEQALQIGAPLQSAGKSDVFLAVLDPVTGTPALAVSFGGLGTDHAAGVALDATHAYVAGVIEGAAGFACGSVGGGGRSIFVLKRALP